jgi:hypothetical protein
VSLGQTGKFFSNNGIFSIAMMIYRQYIYLNTEGRFASPHLRLNVQKRRQCSLFIGANALVAFKPKSSPHVRLKDKERRNCPLFIGTNALVAFKPKSSPHVRLKDKKRRNCPLYIGTNALMAFKPKSSPHVRLDDGERDWFVGAMWDKDDQTERFLTEGIWQNRHEDNLSKLVPADAAWRPDRHQGDLRAQA